MVIVSQRSDKTTFGFCRAGLLLLLTVQSCVANFEFNHLVSNGGLTKNEFQLISLPRSDRIIENSGASIHSVTPTVIPRRECSVSPLSTSEITVAYSCRNRTDTDWIGIYSPYTANISEMVPVRLGYCSDSSDYLKTGKGSLRFRLTNTRSSVAIYMFQGGLGNPLPIAKWKEPVTFEDENEPLSPRISADDGTKELRLTWSSKSSTQPVLRWGRKSGHYENLVAAKTTFFNKSSLFGLPSSGSGWFLFGATHSALFSGVSAFSGQKIYYQFGDEDTTDYSCEFTLDVPLLIKGAKKRPASLIAFGDMGRPGTDDGMTWFHYGRPAADTLKLVSNELHSQSTDAIFFLGDISYASGYLAIWNEFVDEFSLVSSRTPIFPVPGNHGKSFMFTCDN